MPEHDTFDLDAAFRDLEQNLTVAAPGAAVAIHSARRRRRTTVGAVAAAVLVAGAGVAFGQSVANHGDQQQPAGQLPGPAPFDGPHLSVATDGWTPAWGPMTQAVRNKISMTFGGPCLANIPGDGQGAIQALANAHDDAALAVMGDFGSQSAKVEAGWQRVERQLDRCTSAELVSSFKIAGAEGHTYRIDPSGSETAPEYAWIVTTGRQIGELKIFGQSDPLPAVNDPLIARAFLAAIQDPSSDRTRADSGSAVPRVDEAHFARALGSWRSGWIRSDEHQQHQQTVPAAPCYLKPWWHGSWTSNQMSLGGNGHQTLALFHSSADARAAATSLVDTFRRCESTHYTVSRSLEDARSMLVVASGPTVVWVAQHDDGVGVVRVPPGAAAPPQQVTVDVGGLMFAAVDGFAESRR